MVDKTRAEYRKGEGGGGSNKGKSTNEDSFGGRCVLYIILVSGNLGLCHIVNFEFTWWV